MNNDLPDSFFLVNEPNQDTKEDRTEMNLYLHPYRVQWLIRRGPWISLLGLLLIFLAVSQFRDIGFVTGLMLFLFGGHCFSFRAWLQEKGLWMLALLALGITLLMYGTMIWDSIRRELRGPNPRLVGLGWDTTVATAVLWFQVRFLATVTRINRALSRGGWVRLS